MVAVALLILRLLLVFFALAVFGIDLYLIKVYTENNAVVFLWKFYVQFGLEGLLLFIFFISTIIIIVQRRRYLRHVYSAPQYTQVASTFFPSSLGMGGCQLPGLVLRSIFIIGVSAGLLYVSIKNIIDDSRKTLFLPFPRDSAEAASYKDNYAKFDPHNLFQCPKDDTSASVSFTMGSAEITAAIATKLSASLICNMDRSSVSVAVAIGAFAILEVLLTIVWENRRAALNSAAVVQGQGHIRAVESDPPGSSGFAMFTPWKKSTGSKNAEFDHTQHVVQMEPYPVQPYKP